MSVWQRGGAYESGVRVGARTGASASAGAGSETDVGVRDTNPPSHMSTAPAVKLESDHDDDTLIAPPNKLPKLCRVDSDTFYSVDDVSGVITLRDSPIFIDLTMSDDDDRCM